jgi:hyaluronoglucosaminidase
MSTPLFEWRGVVEGFYGPPWEHEDRLWMIGLLGRHGHNVYAYAPKSDPKHRDLWREPYDDAELARFAELVAAGRDAGVTIGFGMSPGLDMDYTSAADRDHLVAKVEPLLDLGVGMLCLLFDDIAVELRVEGLAGAQAHVANELLGRFAHVPHLFVPTDYFGTRGTDYLVRLGKELDPAVAVGWTGAMVVSPVILAADAEAVAADVGRPLALCDNYPVNDGPMGLDLKLGPYPARDAALAQHCTMFLLNPSLQCRASTIAVATAGAWCADPDGYDPEAALDAAVAETGLGAVGAMAATVDALRWSQVDRRPAPRFVSRAAALFRAWKSPRWWDAAAAVAGEVQAHVGAAAALDDGLEDRRLCEELRPWSEQQATGARVLAAALDLLLAARPDIEGTWADDRFDGRVVVPWDRGIIRLAASSLELWQASFGAHLRAYGARVGLAPLVRYGADGQFVGPDVMFAEHAVDQFVLAVLAAVREVQEAWPGGMDVVEVTVDGVPVDVAVDGSFSAGAGAGAGAVPEATVAVRWGGWGTERLVHRARPVEKLA